MAEEEKKPIEEPIDVETEEDKQAVVDYLREAGQISD